MNIKRFPMNTERRRRLNLRRMVVPCQVSSRWLKFPKISSRLRDGEYLQVQVMTSTLDDDLNEKERTLCELVLVKEELLAILKQYRKPRRRAR